MQLFVDQLTNVDFSYLDAQRGMVGETWWASARLDGALDDQGMICDFGQVKKTLRNWLDDEVDHRLLLPVHAPELSLQQQDDSISLEWRSQQGVISMRAPRQAVALIDSDRIDADSVAHWCRQQLKPFFPVNVEQLQLGFVPEQIEGASYHYSHGLKKHLGNCQRIAHGHRSRIVIQLDGQRSHSEEQRWAKRWSDIYLGSDEDVVARDDQYIDYAYQAQQGEFQLRMPAQHCYQMNTDTTVEFIAQHLAQAIKAEHPQCEVTVQAFEGVNKGAIASA